MIEYRKRPDGYEAVDGDKVVGKIKTRRHGKDVAIDDVGVSQDYQRQGIARRLTQLVVGSARDEGAESVNALAQPEYGDLLEKEGFERDGFFARIFLGKNRR